MHEYSVVSQLVSALCEQLDDHPGRIVEVLLHKGELRVLSDPALVNAFEMVVQGTRLEGARLRIESVAPIIRCAACGYDGAPEVLSDPAFHFAIPVLTCPQCGGEVELRAGRELYVDQVTVESGGEQGSGSPEGDASDRS
ncbi:MAG: hydrogenase maturation nickel metallochaperone HypA [Candidatus Bipolaricaulota bacterium]|nr:MAG: hydrogenase maturation nickel metallochaperone HypA [Candidatus Bipolaricaulota bacterium]